MTDPDADAAMSAAERTWGNQLLRKAICDYATVSTLAAVARTSQASFVDAVTAMYKVVEGADIDRALEVVASNVSGGTYPLNI